MNESFLDLMENFAKYKFCQTHRYWYTEHKLTKSFGLSKKQIEWLETNNIVLSTSWIGMVRVIKDNVCVANIDMVLVEKEKVPRLFNNLEFDWGKCAELVRMWVEETMKTGEIDKYGMYKYNGRHLDHDGKEL